MKKSIILNRYYKHEEVEMHLEEIDEILRKLGVKYSYKFSTSVDQKGSIYFYLLLEIDRKLSEEEYKGIKSYSNYDNKYDF